jgi:hypothetical protein
MEMLISDASPTVSPSHTNAKATTTTTTTTGGVVVEAPRRLSARRSAMGAEAAAHVRQTFTDAAMRVKLCAYLDEAAGSSQTSSNSSSGDDTSSNASGGKRTGVSNNDRVKTNRVRVQRFMHNRVVPLLCVFLCFAPLIIEFIVAVLLKFRGNKV